MPIYEVRRVIASNRRNFLGADDGRSDSPADAKFCGRAAGRTRRTSDPGRGAVELAKARRRRLKIATNGYPAAPRRGADSTLGECAET